MTELLNLTSPEIRRDPYPLFDSGAAGLTASRQVSFPPG